MKKRVFYIITIKLLTGLSTALVNTVKIGLRPQKRLLHEFALTGFLFADME
jgi:hypothetical protein